MQFETDNTLTLTDWVEFDVLVVGGGGAGGHAGGGGGGGDVLYFAGVQAGPGSYDITVGGGGVVTSGANTNPQEQSGGHSSSIIGPGINITAQGGGPGKSYAWTPPAGLTPSGSYTNPLTCSQEVSSGGNGGLGSSQASGGGGGAGGPAQPASDQNSDGNDDGTDGGSGISSSITGTVIGYGGGVEAEMLQPLNIMALEWMVVPQLERYRQPQLYGEVEVHQKMLMEVLVLLLFGIG